MINLQQNFKDKVLQNIESIGISQSNVIAIYLCGSALYLDTVNDLDFKVIVKRYNNKAETLRDFNIDGYKVQCHYYTENDWRRVKEYRIANFIAEAADMVLIYGEDVLCRFDVVADKENQEYLIDIYDKFLFNYDKANKRTYEFKPKRLWNFLLFAFKVMNNSNSITADQKLELQEAHDLQVDKEEYRQFFNDLKAAIKNDTILD